MSFWWTKILQYQGCRRIFVSSVSLLLVNSLGTVQCGSKFRFLPFLLKSIGCLGWYFWIGGIWWVLPLVDTTLFIVLLKSGPVFQSIDFVYTRCTLLWNWNNRVGTEGAWQTGVTGCWALSWCCSWKWGGTGRGSKWWRFHQLMWPSVEQNFKRSLFNFLTQASFWMSQNFFSN
jgi:hypothetical protein